MTRAEKKRRPGAGALSLLFCKGDDPEAMMQACLQIMAPGPPLPVLNPGFRAVYGS
jgi:hypothetical protein